MWTVAHTVSTPADPAAIWRLWADVAGWPSWNADLATAELSGSFTEGSMITMTPRDGEPVRLRIAEATPEKLFVDEADLGDVVVRTAHVLEAAPDGRTLVTYRMEITGPAADTVGPSLGPAISGDFPETLEALVALATR